MRERVKRAVRSLLRRLLTITGVHRILLDPRYFLASKYLRGQGIEVGALHNPLPVSGQARVRYVDRLTVSQLREHYPDLNHSLLVDVDVLDDGERLSTLPDGSQDFVIANHFLEHCQDPLLAIENMLRVLRIDGYLYLGIPDKRYTFDKDRPVTTLEHLLRDYREGPEWSRHQHYEEYVHLVHRIEEKDELRRAVDRMMAMSYSIHFHVWTMAQMLELVTSLRDIVPYRCDVEAVHRNRDEVIIILRRSG